MTATEVGCRSRHAVKAEPRKPSNDRQQEELKPAPLIRLTVASMMIGAALPSARSCAVRAALGCTASASLNIGSQKCGHVSVPCSADPHLSHVQSTASQCKTPTPRISTGAGAVCTSAAARVEAAVRAPDELDLVLRGDRSAALMKGNTGMIARRRR